jgi:methyl-accepting chemotaxis protein
MSTGLKTALSITFCFIVALSIILIFTVLNLIENGNEEIEQYRIAELERIKQSLKDHVEVAMATIDINYNNSRDHAYLEKYYGSRLTNIVDIAENILQEKANAGKNGELLLSAKALAQAKAEISHLRYDNGKGYVWITDTASPFPKMIMHPTMSSLEGQVIDNSKYHSAMGFGQNMFAKAVETCQAHGKCFVIDELQPKPTGSIGSTGSNHGVLVVYSKSFKFQEERQKSKHWMIGTAIQIDEVGIDAIEKSRRYLRKIRYNDGEGYFWISNTSETDPRMIMEPIIPSLEGRTLGTDGKFKTVIKSFVEMGKREGSGFSKKYKWPKPPKKQGELLEKNAEKLSYVKLHKGFGWIVGTGAYLDNLEDKILIKKGLVDEQMMQFMLYMVIISIIAVFLVSLLSYFFGPHFFQQTKPEQINASMTPQTASSSIVKPQPTSGLVEIPVMTQATPNTTSDEYKQIIKEVREIRNVLNTSEQSQLLGTVTSSPNQTYQTINDAKKRIEVKNQPQPQTTNTIEVPQFNKVMGNLNKMVR